ncbi:MAG: hypothetical protein DYH12_16895 [Sorangiineae bacterium PRO1]|nr:hypothetical protein [Sorangiineae bacterium PRO1]
MPVELKVPSVGESITDVLIGEWLKSVGDNVKKDEILVMIETDKVTVELPAPVAGVLSEIRVQNGQAARVGDVIGAIDEATMVAEAPPPAPPRAAVAPPVATPVPVTPSVEPGVLGGRASLGYEAALDRHARAPGRAPGRSDRRVAAFSTVT